MKLWTIALALGSLATPAFAQDRAEDEAFRAELEQQERIDEAVVAVDRMIGAVLDMPVGSLARALPPETAGRARVAEGDTLRDFGTRHDPAFEENLRGGARAMTAVLGNMMQRLDTIAPEFERWSREVGEAHPD